MPYKEIKVGAPLSVDDLKKKPAPRARERNPRDVELERLVREVAVGSKSQVLPWEVKGKLPTARLAANKAIKAADLVGTVYASTRPDMPGVILFSRVPLSGRQGPKKAT